MLTNVPALLFKAALNQASEVNQYIAYNVEDYSSEQLAEFRLFITADGHSGFAIKPDGELTAVFSAVKGRGVELVREAIRNGAVHLNAFEGHLTGLYGKCGFVETKRAPNWTAGGPDVVWMKLCPVLKQFAIKT